MKPSEICQLLIMLTFAAYSKSNFVRAPHEWVEIVQESIDAIRRGNMDKVVLARSVVVRADVAFEEPPPDAKVVPLSRKQA